VTSTSRIAAAAFAASLLALAGCGSTSPESDGAKAVAVKLTDAGCDPAKLSLPAGPATFEVANDGADAVSEFEILDGGRILGEVENLAPGLSGRFSLTLRPGSYVTYCPGGKSVEHGVLEVAGGAVAGTSAAAARAVARYRSYVEQQTALLVTRTKAFDAALQADDLARAKALYAGARAPYERIEPVAESFGGLDPAIDARAGDVPAASWTGFHPIEKRLWAGNTTEGTQALGNKLVRDVLRLQTKVKALQLEPAQIANGAVELLDEVSKSKITGEEERYSHIDLVDFEANVDGARVAFESVKPILAGRNAALAAAVAQRFAGVDTALARYRRGDGYVTYGALTTADTRLLSRVIDALAEPLSRVGAHVVAA